MRESLHHIRRGPCPTHGLLRRLKPAHRPLRGENTQLGRIAAWRREGTRQYSWSWLCHSAGPITDPLSRCGTMPSPLSCGTGLASSPSAAPCSDRSSTIRLSSASATCFRRTNRSSCRKFHEAGPSRVPCPAGTAISSNVHCHFRNSHKRAVYLMMAKGTVDSDLKIFGFQRLRRRP